MRKSIWLLVVILVVGLAGCTKPATGQEQTKTDVNRKAGERMVKTVDGIEYAFRWCPAGTFQMGSPSGEEGRFNNETQHQVTLTKGFWMLETEVTQAMWQNVMGESISEKAKQGTYFSDLGGEGSNYPMYYVSWNDCQEFCKKLSEKIGMIITLPTEAQREYACRAGTTTPFFWGSTLNGDKANCNGNFPCGTETKGTYLERTAPVKSYAPNAWGVYDMHGNVCEWCMDWYGDYPNGAVTDPTGPESADRVCRGGDWDRVALGCRSACRYGYMPVYRDSFIGIRVVGYPAQ